MSGHMRAKLGRFSKPSKELLVDYINSKNSRQLTSAQLNFANPVLQDPTGLSTIEVTFANSTGWSSEVQKLTTYRVDLQAVLEGNPLVVYVTENTDDAILAAIRTQYGLLLEKELVTIQLIERSLEESAEVTDVGSFDPADSSAPVVVDMTPTPYLDNLNYTVTFSNDHLIFFGQLQVCTRRALTLMGKDIDSLLDLREFYSDCNYGLPKVDLLIQNGELYVTKGSFPYVVQRKVWNTRLYAYKTDDVIPADDLIAQLVQALEGSAWVSKPTRMSFNLYGSKILYNGFVSTDYSLGDAAYNYVLALELSDYCDNLTGVVKIGYQFSSSEVPGNITNNRASVLPLHSR